MERLKNMKENLISCVQAQIGTNLASVDAKELGEAVDMIKDLEEAIYYCTITKAMEENKKEQEKTDKYFSEYPMMIQDKYPYYYYRDSDRPYGRMYYPENTQRTGMMYTDHDMSKTEYPPLRDHREGRSPQVRKHYMESKEMHHDKEKQMEELEKYIKELSKDLVEMISGATPEEKEMLRQKMTSLMNSI